MKKLIFSSLFIFLGLSYSFAQCTSNITISGSYSTVLTSSSNWIVSSASTNIATGSNVTLEAKDYIELNPDFVADATTVFLAQIVDCTLSTNELNLNAFKIYPNPTTNIVNINSNYHIKSIKLFDVNGRIINDYFPEAKDTNISLENCESGLYFVNITTENGSHIHKIVKK
jgi:hypothetical protein